MNEQKRRRLQERREERREHCQRLCEAAGFKPSATILEALIGLDSDDKRKKLIECFPRRGADVSTPEARHGLFDGFNARGYAYEL